jgi:hypothetical protein
MADEILISADSHFVEPPSMWAEQRTKIVRETVAKVYGLT